MVSIPVARREQGNHQRGPGTSDRDRPSGIGSGRDELPAASYAIQERGGRPALGSAPTGVVEGEISSGARGSGIPSTVEKQVL